MFLNGSSKIALLNILLLILFYHSNAEETLLCTLSLNNKSCSIYYNEQFTGNDFVYGLTESGDSIKPFYLSNCSGYYSCNVFNAFTLPNKSEFALFEQHSFCARGGVCGDGSYSGAVYLGSIRNDSIQLKEVQSFPQTVFENILQTMDSTFYVCGLHYETSVSPPSGYFYSVINSDLSNEKNGVLPCTSSIDCSKYQCSAETINNIKVLSFNFDNSKKNLIRISQLSDVLHISANSPIQKLTIVNLQGRSVVQYIHTSGNTFNMDINLTDTGIKKGLYCFRIVSHDLSIASKFAIF